MTSVTQNLTIKVSENERIDMIMNKKRTLHDKEYHRASVKPQHFKKNMNSSQEFEGKVVLVTGPASGIGRATALLFAAKGASLVLCDLKEDGLETVAKEIEATSGQKPLALVGSVAEDAFVELVIAKTIERFGKLDVLVNNAGIGRKSTIDTPTLMEDLDLVYKVNTRAYLKFCQLASPHLIKSQGNIVNVSSIVSTVPGPAMLSYAMTKAAVTSMTKYLSMELGARGVRVNEVNPGFTDTTIFEVFGWSGPEVRGMFEAAKASLIPMGKYCEPSDVAQVIVHLANNEQSRLTNGLSYAVDGGLGVRGISM